MDPQAKRAGSGRRCSTGAHGAERHGEGKADGTRVAADEKGGFRLPNGEYVAALADGLLLPNGRRCALDDAERICLPVIDWSNGLGAVNHEKPTTSAARIAARRRVVIRGDLPCVERRNHSFPSPGYFAPRAGILTRDRECRLDPQQVLRGLLRLCPSWPR